MINEELTEKFIEWMKENSYSNTFICKLFGVNARTLSNWKSTGIPHRKIDRVKILMEDGIDINRIILDDYTAAKEKAKDILKLGESCGDANLFLQKLYQNSESNVFEFVLTETAEHTFKGLSFRHMEDLYTKGYSSVRSMLSAPESILLSLPGIGKAKLKKIRSNLGVS